MSTESNMERFKLFIFGLALIANVASGQTWSGDTLRINPITFNDPSPVGWNAQYTTIVQFPEDKNTVVQKYLWFRH